MTAGISLEELLADNESATNKWIAWLRSNPSALDVPCDIYNSATVRGVLKHLWAVELRHSQRLLGEDVTSYEAISAESFENLMSVHEKAVANLRKFLTHTTDANLSEVMSSQTLSRGTVSASRRKLFVHIMLHSMRHWAQLSTVLRQHGHPTDWPKDFLFSEAMH